MNKRLAAFFIVEHQEFQEYMADDARQVASRAGYDLEMFFCDGQAVTQIEQLFSVIRLPENERPAGIIVEPVAGDGHARVAQAAARAGIGWVVVNDVFDYMSALRAEYPALPVSSVSRSEMAIGAIQGQQCRALQPSGGELLYLQGPIRSKSAVGRAEGFRDELKGSGLHIEDLIGDWTESGGEEAMKRWLRFFGTTSKLPKVICCQNDSMAVGARRALRSAMPEASAVAITGCDGLPKGGQALVREGELAATVVTPSPAGPAAKLIIDFWEKQTPPAATVTLAPKSMPSIADLSARS